MPKHAVPVPHPHLTNAVQLAGDLWFLTLLAWKFFYVHMFGVLILAVSATFVTVLTFSFVIAGLQVTAVFVMLVGVLGIAVGVAVKAMGEREAMSREVRRVPLDFDWPTNEVWKGYVRPDDLDGEPCSDCQGGQTYAGWWLQRLCQRLEMLARDVIDQERGKPMHPWLANDPYPPTDSTHLFMPATRVLRPSKDMLALIAGLEGVPEEQVHGRFWGGRDHMLFRAIVKAAGLEHWGGCETCQGEGTLERYPGQKAEAGSWKAEDPPAGDGWQLWETVSEGSPVSPVFAEDEGLAQWLTTPAGGEMAGPSRRPMTIDQARGFVRAGWAPSGVINAGGMHDGAAYVGSAEVLKGIEDAS
jgi:hypothetical protein